MIGEANAFYEVRKMPPSSPPSLVLIYLRAALGALTKKRSLGADVACLTEIPKETLAFSVDPKHVQEFVNVVNRGNLNSLSASRDAKVPIAYLQCLLNAMPMNMVTHSKFPLDIVGSVHESSTIESWKPLYVSDSEELRASCYLLPDIARSDKNDVMFKVKTTVETEHGGKSIMDITNEYRVLNPQRHKVKVVPENNGNDQVPVDYFNDETRQHLSTWQYPIDTGRSYAALNGDINPIHIFPITAMLFGYKSCISHGMYSVCKLMNEPRFADAQGPSTVTARFTRPTILPNMAVMAFLKKGSDEYVIGTKNKDGEFKETVKGTISLHQ